MADVGCDDPRRRLIGVEVMRGWCITWGEHSWTDDMVPASLLEVVADIGGDTWQIVSPWNSPTALMAWLRALVATVSPGDTPNDQLNAATVAVWTAPLGAVLAALSDPPSSPPAGDRAADPSPSPAPDASAAAVVLDVDDSSTTADVEAAAVEWVQVTRDPG